MVKKFRPQMMWLLVLCLVVGALSLTALANGDNTIAPAIINNHKAEIADGQWVTIYSEATIKGTESMVVKLYSGDKLLGTTTLVDTNKVLLTGESKTVTWHFFLQGQDDWWTTELAEDVVLVANEIPTRTELWVDGSKVAENTVSMSASNDNLGDATVNYNWGDLDGVKVAVDSNGNYYETLQEAINQAGEDATVTLLGDTKVEGTQISGGEASETAVQIPSGKKITIDLGGNTLQGSLYADSATITIKNGKISSWTGASGIEVENTDLTLTSTDDELLTIVSANRHAIRAKSGNLVINGGTYTSHAAGTTHGLYVSGSAVVTIHDGEFYTDGEDTSGCALMIKDDDCRVTVNGGHFASATNTADGTICITANSLILGGGTFIPNTVGDDGLDGEMRTATYLDGYVSVKNADGSYKVIKLTDWSQVADTSWYDAENPQESYTLSSAQQLAGLAQLVNGGNNFAGVTITLSQDVDLSSYNGKIFTDGIKWTPIGKEGATFTGHFDGGEKTISNLYVNQTENYAGFFGSLAAGEGKQGSVKNIKLHNVNVYGGSNTAALAGCPYTTDIDNCHISGTISINGNGYVGGIGGQSYGDITNCSVIGDTNAANTINARYWSVGGIVGQLYGGRVVGAEVANVTITGNYYATAGIAGLAQNDGNAVCIVIDRVAVTNTTIKNNGSSGAGSIVGTGSNSQSAYIVNYTVSNVTVTNQEVATDTVCGTDLAEDNYSVGLDTAAAGYQKVTLTENIYTTKITGGTFVHLMDGHIADGYVAVDNGNGTYTVKKAVAAIGDVKYETLEAAINAAVSGDTIVLLADCEADNVIIKSGVTLDLGSYTLTAQYVVGFNGSFLTATPAQGKLIVAKDNVALPFDCYTGKYDILPIYNGDHYEFAYFRVNTNPVENVEASNDRGLTVDAENHIIQFKFAVDASQNAIDLLKNGAEDNGLSIIVRLTWQTEDGLAQQDFFYNETLIGRFFSAIGTEEKLDFTFNMSGYDALNIQEETLTVCAMVVTDSGVVSQGTIHADAE